MKIRVGALKYLTIQLGEQTKHKSIHYHYYYNKIPSGAKRSTVFKRKKLASQQETEKDIAR